MYRRILLCLLFAAAAHGQPAPVRMTLNGAGALDGEYRARDVQALKMENGEISITFAGDGSATSLIKNGRELVHNLNGLEGRDPDRQRTWYIDYNGGRGRLVADTISIVESTPEMGHIAIIDSGRTSTFALEHHILLKKGESGLYGYVICRNPKNVALGGEMRSMYRLDRDIFDWAYTSERTGQQPRYADLVKLPGVQDETWKMPDGTIYQKYDYSGYLAENPLWGHYGHGFGVWFMPVSTEYYAAGPLRQDLLVHQDALILNYFQGAHYGGGGPGAFPKNEKLFGPWFTYINSGEPAAMIADAKHKAQTEQAQWPYEWMDEDLFPLDRTRVTGKLKVADGRSAAGAIVVLAKPGEEIYKQAGDFIFSAKADPDGRFSIPHVREGAYALYAYATQGSITAQLEKDDIAVHGAALDLGDVVWSPPKYSRLVWQIGHADRMSGEFKYGDQPRNIKWIGMVPADLTFTIDKSTPREDWYFAQAKPGNWDVSFTLDGPAPGTAHLTLALAGVSQNPKLTVSINGQEIKQLAYANDAATYRAALRGARYQLQDIAFPANLLHTGANIVRLALTAVGNNGGIMYDTVKLEIE
ncbi:MAG TPA: polysaccharide lyase family protein [Candidatus Sulfopaludibacter sp.]|jgi:rhamnogalacturonan endolyase|nr:polysaccharide lyase family protein [Candidatus Sulfopaludibacter sp.]